MSGQRGARIAAAALEAVAEAPLWFFFARFLDAKVGGSLEASAGDFAVWVAGFTAAVAVATSLSAWPGLGPSLLVAAIGLGLAEGSGLSTAQPGGYVAAVLATLLIGLRVGVLALRDWREPVNVAFAVGAVALLIVAMGSGFAGAAGAPLVAWALVLYFGGLLGSRALSARMVQGWGAGDARRLAAALAALAGALGVAALFGGTGGLFQRVGRLVAPVVGVVVGGAVWVIGQLARPVFWLAEQFSVDVERLREALEDFRLNTDEGMGEAAAREGSTLERLLGLGFVLLLGLGLFLAYRRLRPRAAPREGPPLRDRVPVEDVVGMAPDPASAAPRRPLLRRTLPQDLIRRWYAEALTRLDSLRLPRSAARTPREYRREVDAAFPQTAASFAILTSAYELVRYGAGAPDRDDLRAIRAERDRLMRSLRDADPIPEADPGAPAGPRSG